MAALDGTVVLAAYIAGEGRVVMIQHAQNFLTVYRHCGGLMCASGDQVKGGDVIALTQDRKDADGGSHPFSTLSCGMEGFRLIRLGMWCFRFGWQGFE